MLIALPPSVAGRRDAHQPRIEPVLHVAFEDAVLDQHCLAGRRAFVVDAERATPVGKRSVVDHGDAGCCHPLSDPPAERTGALAVEIAFQTVADRFVQDDAGPAGGEQHRHLARRGIDAVEIDQRLPHRLVHRVPPRRAIIADVEQPVVEIAPAETVAALFAPPVRFGDDRYVKADQRADIGGGEAVGADDLHHAPAACQAGADLRDARVFCARHGVDGLQKRHLVFERHAVQRAGIGIEVAIAAPGRSGAAGGGGIEQLQRFARAPDCRLADFVGVGETGHLARHAAQTKAAVARIIGRFQPSVIPAECLAGHVLQIQFAIVAPREHVGGCALRGFGVDGAEQVGAGVAGGGRHGHGDHIGFTPVRVARSSGGPDRRLR